MVAINAGIVSFLVLSLPAVLAKHHTYGITGVHSQGVQPRHEVRELHHNYPNQWNMYLLALQALQQEDQGKKLSYYQIEGIHGVPNIPWDHAKQEASGTGYCEHDGNMFPLWHRPLISLFEMRIHHHAVKIARKFHGKEKKAMEHAAHRLRIPYYDWAIDPAPGNPSWPTELSKKKVSVRTPHGPKTIHNPLYSYKYHSLEIQWYAPPWNAWHVTKRWPTDTSPHSDSQNSLVEATMQQQRGGQKYTLFQFFTSCKTWSEISNDKAENSSPGCATSLEQLHNNMHNFIGGTVGGQQGHMTIIPYSAHDPSFMLHHTQVDRLLAMWQSLYPDKFVTPEAQSDDTFDVAAGKIMDAHTPLKPFHKNSHGDYWTSAAARHTKTFGYKIPEYHHGGHNPKKMRSRVKKLYGPNSSKHAVGKSHHKIKKRQITDDLWYDTNEEAMPEIVQRELEDEEREAAADAVLPRDTPAAAQPLIASNGSSFEYIANIQTTRYGLGNSYNIYLFLSDPSNANPDTWAYDPNVVGAFGVWSEPGKQAKNITSTSSVPLTLALTDRVRNGLLSSLAELLVVPFLAKNLKWYVVGPGGTVLDAAKVPGFQISVVSSTLRPASAEEEFPEWSEFIELPAVTRGRPGGSRGGMLRGILGGRRDAAGAP